MTDVQTMEQVTYCEVHPDIETALRCNKCNRLMCPDCAVYTSVGYRCRECVRQHENKFFEGTNLDYMIVFAVALIASASAGFFMRFLGGGVGFFSLILVFVLAAPIGGAIGQIALQLTQRRRGRYSGEVAVAGIVLGGLGIGLLTGAITLILLLFVGVAASAVYGRFKLRI